MNPSVDTLYIMSAGHSGSTLLNLLLGAHSRCVAVSELTYLAANVALNETCTCGAAIRQCAFWNGVSVELGKSTGIDLMRDPSSLELGLVDSPRGAYRARFAHRWAWKARRALVQLSQMAGIQLPAFMRERFDDSIANRLALYDAVRSTSGAAVVVDASKGYLPGIAVKQARPARTRLILLSRDGRAVFHSNLKRGFPRRYSVRTWHNFYSHALPLLERYVPAEDVLRVRYEDLATDPERELRRICAHAGADFEAGMLDPRGKPQHLTSGNDMRLGRELVIRLDTGWQSDLADSDKAYFQRVSGTLNRRLGYA